MRRDDPTRLLKAALVWDTRALLQAKDASARAFFDALTMANIQNEAEVQTDAPLGAGAKAIVATLRGDAGLAKSLLEERNRESLWARLFRVFLRAWLFADETRDLLDPLANEVKRVRQETMRAHLLTKLTGLAVDVGEWAKAHSYIRDARFISPRESPMGFQLQLTETNLFQVMPESLEAPARTDDLVDYPWIRARAFASARRALIEHLEAQVASPWSSSFRFGLTAAEGAVLAEMQASWAGALWLRSDLRTLAGSLLLSGAQQASDIAYGAALWIRGGGKNVSQILDSAEPRFDEGTADAIFEYLRGFGGGPWEPGRLAEAVSATWDLVSDSVAVELLEKLRPRAGDHPTLATIRRSWAVLSLRIPEAWEARYWQLAEEDRRALATSITPDLAELLPVDVAQELWAFIRSGIEDSTSVEGWLLFGALMPRFGNRGDKRLIASASPEAIAQLAFTFPGLVPQREIARAITNLARRVKREAQEAINGTMKLGAYRPRVLLGQAISSRSILNESALRALTDSAVDSRVPADYRMESLRALILVSRRHAIPLKLIEEATQGEDSGAPSQFGEAPRELLRILRLAVVATRRKVGAYSADLVRASRSPDARVRQVAVEAAGLALKHGRSTDLEYVITSGLFDPQEHVVLAALHALQDHSGLRSETRRTLAARLAEMYASYGREVRAAVLRATSRKAAVGRMAQGRDLLRAGLEDRSWLVRDAAKRAMVDSESPKAPRRT